MLSCVEASKQQPNFWFNNCAAEEDCWEEVQCRSCCGKGKRYQQVDGRIKEAECKPCEGRGEVYKYIDKVKMAKEYPPISPEISDIITDMTLKFKCCHKEIATTAKIGDRLFYHHDIKRARSDEDFVHLKIAEIWKGGLTTSQVGSLPRSARGNKRLRILNKKGCIICGKCGDDKGLMFHKQINNSKLRFGNKKTRGVRRHGNYSTKSGFTSVLEQIRAELPKQETKPKKIKKKLIYITVKKEEWQNNFITCPIPECKKWRKNGYRDVVGDEGETRTGCCERCSELLGSKYELKPEW